MPSSEKGLRLMLPGLTLELTVRVELLLLAVPAHGVVIRPFQCTFVSDPGEHLLWNVLGTALLQDGQSWDCGNRKHLRAEQIEEQVWGFVRGLLRDPERIRAGLDRLIDEERAEAGRDPQRDAQFWLKKITEAEVERRGYHRLAVKGHMTDEELATALAELDEIRETAEHELEAVRARGEALERLERDRDALMESYAGMVSETLEDLVPEERHRIYKLLRLGVRFRPDWPLEIAGIFAQVGEEAETSSSDRKPSPLGV